MIMFVSHSICLCAVSRNKLCINLYEIFYRRQVLTNSQGGCVLEMIRLTFTVNQNLQLPSEVISTCNRLQRRNVRYTAKITKNTNRKSCVFRWMAIRASKKAILGICLDQVSWWFRFGGDLHCHYRATRMPRQDVCPSVCPSVTCRFCVYTYTQSFFQRRVSPPFQFFHTKPDGNIPMGTP